MNQYIGKVALLKYDDMISAESVYQRIFKMEQQIADLGKYQGRCQYGGKPLGKLVRQGCVGFRPQRGANKNNFIFPYKTAEISLSGLSITWL